MRESEDLEHLFYRCPEKMKLWYDLADRLIPEIDLYQYLNVENILLGVFKERKPLENSVILACKRYIYNAKWLFNMVNIMSCLKYIKHIMMVETNIRCQQIKNYNIQKWAPIQQKLTNI